MSLGQIVIAYVDAALQPSEKLRQTVGHIKSGIRSALNPSDTGLAATLQVKHLAQLKHVFPNAVHWEHVAVARGTPGEWTFV